MRYLSLSEVLWLHLQVIEASGGSAGVRDLGALEAAVAQPRSTFDGEDLYPSLLEKAAALAFSLVGNHPFIDGNKRVGHAAMEVMLLLNGVDLDATVDDQEKLFLELAAGSVSRKRLLEWLASHTRPSK